MAVAASADVLGEMVEVPRIPWRRVISWLMILGVLGGWAAFLRPPSLGGSTGYVIVSGTSMQPLMETGDLAVVRQQPDYDVGDVLAYRIPEGNVGGGMLVIHRVIGGDAHEGFVLKGDNREHADVWRPTSQDIVGSLQAHVPHVGMVLFLMRSPLVVATMAGLLGFWFIVLRGAGSREDSDVSAETPTAAEEPETPITLPQATPAPVVVPSGFTRPERGSLVGAIAVGVAIGVVWGGTGRR